MTRRKKGKNFLYVEPNLKLRIQLWGPKEKFYNFQPKIRISISNQFMLILVIMKAGSESGCCEYGSETNLFTVKTPPANSVSSAVQAYLYDYKAKIGVRV